MCLSLCRRALVSSSDKYSIITSRYGVKNIIIYARSVCNVDCTDDLSLFFLLSRSYVMDCNGSTDDDENDLP